MKQLIILVSLFLVISCGARKVQKSTEIIKEKIETEVLDTSKIVLKIEKLSNDFIIEPIDSLKPIVIIDNLGKHTSYLNARIKNSVNKTLIDGIIYRSRKVKIKAVKDTEIKFKAIERKESYWYLWFILLIPLYYLYKKFKPL